MVDTLCSGASDAIGIDGGGLDLWQMVVRAIVVYLVGIALVRLAEKRFIGKFTAFDLIMGILLGSLLSRAITQAGPFLATLAAGITLVLLHFLFAVLSFHFERFGNLVNGRARTLVEDGQIQWGAMRESHINEQDLMSKLRENGQVDDVRRVKLAQLERSGNISVVTED
jgi:uncharacterized membrane protein YcaP (DUF421 family)